MTTTLPVRNYLIEWGESLPWFRVITPFENNYGFDNIGARYAWVAVLPETDSPDFGSVITALSQLDLTYHADHLIACAFTRHRRVFEDKRVRAAIPGKGIMLDDDGSIHAAFGALHTPDAPETSTVRPHWLLVDPDMRVLARGNFRQLDLLETLAKGLAPVSEHAGVSRSAPVLVVPRVLPLALCKRLIEVYRAGSPSQSGFMMEDGGRTVARTNPNFKRRTDVKVTNETLRTAIRHGIGARLAPMIKRAFQFQVDCIERYIVARYGSEDRGFFDQHRDNTTKGTAHRRFAVTINLNDDFDGGTLRFPEFGMTDYRAPVGGAVVFSCSLMHMAQPVTRGERFATLPFLYGFEDAKTRDANRALIDT